MVRIIEMLSKIVKSMEMPANPLDQLTDLLGGASKVAEMTGRKGQLIREDENTVIYQKRRQNVSHSCEDLAILVALLLDYELYTSSILLDAHA